MIDLSTLEPQKISRNLQGKSFLFYGDAGVGKTTLASKFPKSLILGFERGTNALNNVYVAPVKTWNDFKNFVNQLVRKQELQERFEVIVIDTADEAFKLCEKYVCNQAGVSEVKDVAAYGGGYKILDNQFMEPFRDLNFAGYGVVFISHSAEKQFIDDSGNDYNKIIPALPSRPFNLINKMVDVVGYIRQISSPTDNGIQSERYIFFRSDNRFFTKSRFKYIEPRAELSYDAFLKAIYDAIDKEAAEDGGTASNEIDPYLDRSFDDLMEEAKMLWGEAIQQSKAEEVSKILEEEFGKPIKFSEILPEQIDTLKKVLFEAKNIL